jgi:hypothetical protein
MLVPTLAGAGETDEMISRQTFKPLCGNGDAMVIRSRLRRYLLTAWSECISKDYDRQRINSERSLQASFWSQLNIVLPEQFRMFVEPKIRVKKKDRSLIPDIVICNTTRVICVVEIKYLPRGKPAYNKDIESLAMLARHRGSLCVSNSRYRGPAGDPKEYEFHDKLLCVWAGVHRPPKDGSFWTSDTLSKGQPCERDIWSRFSAQQSCCRNVLTVS